MKKYFLKSAQIALVLVYLVVFAGAFVRLTGSGMGCPDWPKCFGYYIPPTQEKELLFTAQKDYSQGQVIIKDKQLLVAKTSFTATLAYDANNWQRYTKHNYAIFNPWHTWVEYINRLFGALAGIACIIAFICSLGYYKTNKKIVFLSFSICLLMAFQAWLGKTVVDSVLNPFKITTHMLAALLIIAFQLITIYAIKQPQIRAVFNKKFHYLLLLALAITLIQIVLGTSVREHVDTISETGSPEPLWLQNPSISFYIHRSFSIVVLLLNGYLWQYNQKQKLGHAKTNAILILIALEVLTGIAMYYFHFPFGSQTIHLVLATILFGYQFYLLLESQKKIQQKA